MSDTSTPLSTALEHNLVVALELEAGGTAKINTGHIERFNLSLQPYGYTCAVQFSAYGDDLDKIFAAPDVAKATLTINSFEQALDPPEGPLLVLKGIVADKCFKRMPCPYTNKSMRLYEITFHDFAKAVWEHHFPINIYIDLSMKDIIEKHTNPDITIKYDWSQLEKKHPITAFSLPHRDWLPEDQQVSFYSFLNWYLQQENGVLAYDYKNHGYTLSGKKIKAAGKPLDILEWWVDPPVCFFPQPPRANMKQIKPSFESMPVENKENAHAFKSIRRDSISADNYRCYPEQAHEKIQSPLMPEKKIVEVEFNAIEGNIPFDQLVPGSQVGFKGNHEGTWSSDSTYKRKTFGVRSLFIQADKYAVSEELDKPKQIFRLQIKTVLEEDGEPFVSRPFFLPPVFPFAMQGKIFSDIGEEEQSTYKIAKSDQVPLGQYEIEIPLIEDKKRLVVPFTPDLMSGQFYYPFSRGQRVELSIYFHTAKILRLSDWQPLARLPAGIQGCQTVWASNGKDKFTLMRHEFVDGKTSVFTIKQSSSETQSQTVEIKEETITVMVDEKDKKTLSIILNKEKGFTLALEDKSAGTSQQIAFDGESMTHTCKGTSDTSVIVQKPDEILFDCKTLSIKSEEVSFNVKNQIDLIAKNKVNMTTKVFDAAASTVNLGS